MGLRHIPLAALENLHHRAVYAKGPKSTETDGKFWHRPAVRGNAAKCPQLRENQTLGGRVRESPPDPKRSLGGYLGRGSLRAQPMRNLLPWSLSKSLRDRAVTCDGEISSRFSAVRRLGRWRRARSSRNGCGGSAC
jgi:hypothetical protein